MEGLRHVVWWSGQLTEVGAEPASLWVPPEAPGK